MIKSILFAILVSASIDSTTIFLGDQTDLHLQATMQPGERVSFPIYGELLTSEVEIVDRTIVDTITLQDGLIQLNQYLTLTSFHDSLYCIAPIAFLSGEDTLYSEPLTLNIIQPFEIDTTNAITDIKPIQKAPIWWWGIIRWILLGLAVAGAGVGVYYLVRYLKRKEDGVVEEEVIELRPAEEVAKEQLDRIRDEKIWQQGETKRYHTELTDVLRTYISRRFEVRSTEKTSDETIRELKPILDKEQHSLFVSLKQVLQLADLVKFAKWSTTPEENEQALRTAYQFVDETTQGNL